MDADQTPDEYARFAFLYDPVIGPALRPLHRSMAAILLEQNCRSVADLCCGTGLLASKVHNKGMNVIGVDISRHMLEVAGRKNPGLPLLESDATDLPFEDDSFDAACISFALHEKPEDTAMGILAEARRTVRHGGTILVLDYVAQRPGTAPWSSLIIRTVERMAGKRHHACFQRYMNKGGTEAMLARAELSARCVKTSFGGWAGIYAAD